MVLVIEFEDMKRKHSPVNKIGTKKDEVHGKEVDRATQMLSALSVAYMAFMKRTITQTHVSVKHVDSLVRSMEQVDYSGSLMKHVKSSSSSKFEEEELVIQRLDIAKRDLHQRIEKEVRDNSILQASA